MLTGLLGSTPSVPGLISLSYVPVSVPTSSSLGSTGGGKHQAQSLLLHEYQRFLESRRQKREMDEVLIRATMRHIERQMLESEYQRVRQIACYAMMLAEA